MRTLRILVTGVGRRIELLQAFRQAALILDINLKIYGADMAGTAPALLYCDFVRKVCGMKEKEYISSLLEICKMDNIDLLVPTIDTDLLVLSKEKQKFKELGVQVLISEPEMIKICRDKNYTAVFFESCGLKVPKTYNNYKEYSGGYPCFIKPKGGSSSIDAFKVKGAEELVLYAKKIGAYIIQPFIDGKEYTVDIFCDFNGKPIYITPRERLAVRAGEVLKTEIVKDDVIVRECEQLIERFKPCGPMTVQLIRDGNTGEDYYIEINPRYGGGAPLSMKSGARTAEALLRLLLGERIAFQEDSSSVGAIYSRFDQSVCIFDGNSVQPVRGVIFDLDDTLYSERQYVKSGFQKIGEFLGRADAAEKLWQYFLEGALPINRYLDEISCQEKLEECIDIYRKQKPQIALYDGVPELLLELKDLGLKIGIITDGRVEGQQNKIAALGLDDIADDIIITDELGGIQFRKPNDIAFRIMQCRWKMPFEQMVYVGDNLGKDFQAPVQLGMKCLYFRNLDGLYKTEEERGFMEVRDVPAMRKAVLSFARGK